MTTPDRSVNFPTEFRIPTQEITAREVINLFQGHRLDIRVMFGELGSKITLPEYKGLETENRSGEAFVLYPEAIALNGTVVPPESFREVFQPQEMSDIIIGEQNEKKQFTKDPGFKSTVRYLSNVATELFNAKKKNGDERKNRDNY